MRSVSCIIFSPITLAVISIMRTILTCRILGAIMSLVVLMSFIWIIVIILCWMSLFDCVTKYLMANDFFDAGLCFLCVEC